MIARVFALILLSAGNVRGLYPANSDAYREPLRALTDRLGNEVLDQYEWLVSKTEDPDSVQFRHDAHSNARGHEAVAKIALDAIGQLASARSLPLRRRLFVDCSETRTVSRPAAGPSPRHVNVRPR